MRMWNVPPEVMCRQHLLGEHLETHMFLGTLNKGISLQGYIDKGLIEVGNIIPRHNVLVEEMEKRGYNHKSPMPTYLSMPSKYFVNSGYVDTNANLIELADRCEACNERQEYSKTHCLIYCVGCQEDVEADLISGKMIYPGRADLADIPIWRCPTCMNTVGCHHKTEKPTRPLGVIATPELKKKRMKIHSVLDPMWESGKYTRQKVYSQLSEDLGYSFHTANLRSVAEANRVIRVLCMYNRYGLGELTSIPAMTD